MSGELVPRVSPVRRHAIEAYLDRVVRANRVTIAVVFPAVGAGTLIASQEGWLPGVLAFNAVLLLVGVAVMRAPLLVGLLPIVRRRTVAALGVLSVFVYAIEVVGVRTGWPYGSFEYGISLGPMLAGIPLALPLLFIPIVLNAFLLSILVLGRFVDARVARLGVAVAIVLLMDLVLDPAAVALGFWGYEAAGGFYGVPWSNYRGWVLATIVAVVIVDQGFDHVRIRERLETCRYVTDDLVSFLILWGAVNLWYGHWLPVAVTLGLAGLLLVGRWT